MTISNFQKVSCKDFKEKSSWNKYRSEITTYTKNKNLSYLIDSTFRNINRLFILSLKNDTNDPGRNFFEKFYILLIEIKDFKALIGDKTFFDQPVKHKKEAQEKPVVDMSGILYNRKFIRSFVSSKILKTYWY